MSVRGNRGWIVVAVAVVLSLVVVQTPAGALTFKWNVRNISIDGIYQPLPGDYDGDGVTDIFWYAPGSKPDVLWYGIKARRGQFRKVSYNISGNYLPIRGDFGGDDRTDLLMWGLGPRPDVLLIANGRSSIFTKKSVTINGLFYLPLVMYDIGTGKDDLVWYGPGKQPDSIWHFDDRGSGNHSVIQARIDSTSAKLVHGLFNYDDYFDLIVYQEGSAPDEEWIFRSDGTFSKRSISVNCKCNPIPYVLGKKDGTFSGVTGIYWSARGNDRDSLWRSNGNGTFSETPTAQVKDFSTDSRGKPIFITGFDIALNAILLVARDEPNRILIDNGTANNVYAINDGLDLPTSVYTPLSGDFDGDAVIDLLWYGAVNKDGKALPDYIAYNDTVGD